MAESCPVPGVSIMADIAIIKREIDFYTSQLGLLEKGSNRFSLLSFNTQSEIKALSTTLGTAMQIGGLVAAYSTESVVEEFARFIPVIGIAIASSLSYAATYYFLSKWLEKLEEFALKVLEEKLGNISSH